MVSLKQTLYFWNFFIISVDYIFIFQIEQDFNAIYPDCEDNFLAKFPSFYTNKILGYIAKCRPDIMKKTDNLPVNDGEYFKINYFYLLLNLFIDQDNSKKMTFSQCT